MMIKFMVMILCLLFLGSGCQLHDDGYEAFGLDSDRINDLLERIEDGTYANIHSLLIMKDEQMVVEKYFSRHVSTDIHTLQSVTKSVTSAIIGIALDKGFIADTDMKVLDFFGQYTLSNLNDWKKELRIHDILTMRTGVDYNENGSGSPHWQLNALSSGWDLFYLNRPMLAAPGTVFNYDSGGVILLSAILNQACDMHADIIADQYLFPQLGIMQRNWVKNAEGHPHTGGGLYLLPGDMIKFGQLYLNKGRYNGQRVVPESWVVRSFTKTVDVNQWGSNIVGYGYLWWIFRPANRSMTHEYVYAAMGAMGQYIFVIPEYRMVVAVTAGTTTNSEFANPQSFLYSHILDAVL